MDIAQAIRERRSVRTLNAQRVSREAIEELIEIARFAPSAHNAQPWSFVMLDENLDEIWRIVEEGTRSAGLANAWKKVRNASVLLAACAKGPCDPNDIVEWEMTLEGMGAIIQNILLLAHSRGLGACWLGGTTKRVESAVKEHLMVPQDMRLIALISFGYYDSASQQPKSKKSVGDLLSYNFYGRKKD